MGFIVGFTFIIWLLVAVVAFGARPAQTAAGAAEKAAEKSREKEHQQ